VNDLAEPVSGVGVQVTLTTDVHTLTVVNDIPATQTKGAERFVKTQCMHCVSPACASACAARALEKTVEGPVVYHPERCLGCRYCMVACPFGVPRFEYDKAAPYIVKCQFCAERQKEGKLPGCASAWTGALQFSARLNSSRLPGRIYQNPDNTSSHLRRDRGRRHELALHLGHPVRSAGIPRRRRHDGVPGIHEDRARGGALRAHALASPSDGHSHDVEAARGSQGLRRRRKGVIPCMRLPPARRRSGSGHGRSS
jgi:Fe-S-cluster-containing dehydrogenase component